MHYTHRAATSSADFESAFGWKKPRQQGGGALDGDTKACTPGRDCQVFRELMFVESNSTAPIFGIEHEDGRPRGVNAMRADKQQVFIDFLREQNEIRDSALVGLRALFQGSEYASQARAVQR